MDIENVLEFINRHEGGVPKDGTDYSNGYHLALALVKLFCKGQCPFDLMIGGLKVSPNND